MGTTRISADDALQLAADRRAHVPMQLGALLQLRPAQDGEPGAQQVATLVGQRLGALPQLRRRLERAPLGLGRPHWTDAGSFSDVPVVPLRARGRTQEDRGRPQGSGPSREDHDLLDHFARLVTTRLPRDRPLWRAEVLADDAGHAVGLALVAHHVLTDGIGALTLLDTLVDHGGEAADPGGETADLGADRAADPGGERAPHAVGAAAARSRRARAGRLAWAARELGMRQLRTAGRTTLLAPTGPRRRVDVVDVGLRQVREASRRHGATVNELVLVAVSGAVATLLAQRGDPLSTLVVSVPVSGRASGPELGNAVGVLPVRIPLVPDPERRLAAIRAAKSRLVAGHRGSSSALLGPLFRILATLGLVQWFVSHQRIVHTFETNVRGPGRQLAVAGVPVLRIVPLGVNPGNVTVSFAVLSAGGRLVVSLVTDPAHVPDHDVLATAVAAELDGLLREELPAVRGDTGRGQATRGEAASSGR